MKIRWRACKSTALQIFKPTISIDIMRCTICPKGCNADRAIKPGFCGGGPEPEVATICVHKGEEPPLCGEKGICNVFFVHCNLQCVYCQNDAISLHRVEAEVRFRGVEAIVDGIAEVLRKTENIVGFVTPSHYANHIPAIVEGLHERGLFPTTVYNTGGYDSVETLRMLAPYIDIYLPDMKYMDCELALRYSHAADYPEVALRALREMYDQKGSSLPTDERGLAYRGIIVRHLVLPGQVQNSLDVMDALADISLKLHVALMSQYFPPKEGLPDELSRTLTEEEYAQVVEHCHNIGLYQVLGQELEAQVCYRPDFSKEEAFEGQKAVNGEPAYSDGKKTGMDKVLQSKANKNKGQEAKQKSRKTIKLNLDEPDPTFTTENTRVIMFQTDYENYEFVMALNDAFGLGLTRMGTMEIGNCICPYFYYFDEVTRLTYMTFDADHGTKKDNAFSLYDKMLLIRGRDAKAKQQLMYKEVVGSPIRHDENDIMQHSHCEKVETLHQGIISMDCFSFSPKLGCSTTLCNGWLDTMPKGTASCVRSIQTFTNKIFKKLNMDTYADEEKVVFINKEDPITKVFV